jgi:hypothetical protein
MKCAGCGDPLPPQTIGRRRKWCSERCRRDTLYSGTCVDCGARTNGNDGPGKAAERCRPCRHEFERANAPWSREGVIHAIQEFAETYGRPPRVTDFSKAHAAARGHAGRVPDGHRPAQATIAKYCGSWNEAVRAAGLEPFDDERDHDWGPGRPTVRNRVFGVTA